MEGDRGCVDTAKKRSDCQLVLVGLLSLEVELLLANRILKVSPNGVALGLVGWILDLEEILRGLSRFAVENDVVFC